MMEAKFAKSAYRIFLLWCICSFFGVTVSTFIEAVWIGNFVGSAGLAVANIATPVFLLYTFFGITLGTGASVLIGKSLGAAEVARANERFGAVLGTGLVVGLLFAVPALLFCSDFCRFLGANETLLPPALRYLTGVFLFAPMFVLYQILSAAVRTDGEPRLAAIASGCVIVTNLILDLWFLWRLRLGLFGASTALCIAETLGTLVLLTHFGKKEALLRLQLCLPTIADIRDFVVNGFGVGSAFLFQAVVMLVFNTMLLRGAAGNETISVAIFGIIYTMSTIPGAFFDAAGAAAATVIAILGGERDKTGMWSVYQDGLRIVIAVGLLLAILFTGAAERIPAFFGLQGNLQTAAAAFRIYAWSIVFAGVNVLTVSFWQAIGRRGHAFGVAFLRSLILMLLLGAVLIQKWNIIGLAWVYVGSEAICLLLILAIRFLGNTRAYMDEKYSVTDRVYERYYPIEEGSMEAVTTEMNRLCEEWELPYQKAFFISFIVEELILSIMKYGRSDPSKKYYVSVRVMDNGDGEYILRIRDNVRRYNPFDLHGDEVDRAAMRFIFEKAKYCEYQRKLIFQYLYVKI